MSDEENKVDLTDAEMLMRATAFDVMVDVTTRQFVRIERRYYAGGGKAWAIVNEDKFVLNIFGAWEYESPVIAARSENFIARTRWDNPRLAMRAALEAIAKSQQPDGLQLIAPDGVVVSYAEP